MRLDVISAREKKDLYESNPRTKIVSIRMNNRKGEVQFIDEIYIGEKLTPPHRTWRAPPGQLILITSYFHHNA